MDIDRAAGGLPPADPRARDDLFPGERAVRVRRQELQQLELLEDQLDLPAVQQDPALVRVDDQARWRPRSPPGAAPCPISRTAGSRLHQMASGCRETAITCRDGGEQRRVAPGRRLRRVTPSVRPGRSPGRAAHAAHRASFPRVRGDLPGRRARGRPMPGPWVRLLCRTFTVEHLAGSLSIKTI